jgi:hypothetical protein
MYAIASIFLSQSAIAYIFPKVRSRLRIVDAIACIFPKGDRLYLP